MLLVAQVFPLNADGAASGDAQSRLIRTLARLPEQWTALRDRRIENEAVDCVLIHPEIGVALVNLARQAEGAAHALRHRLERERFAAYFPGALPLVPLAVAPEAISEVGEHLAEAFESAPRLEVADSDWVDALIEILLLPDDFAMAPVETSRPLADETDEELALTAEPALLAAAARAAPERGGPFEPPLWSLEEAPPSAELSEPESEPEEPPVVINDPILPAANAAPTAPLPAPLLIADEHIALARPRRHGEHWPVAAAVAAGVLLGLLLLDWPQQPPPTRIAVEESTVPLPTPPASDTGATPPVEASSPPPVPPGPVTMLAAKPLATPPPLRHATAVAPLPSPPPVVAAPPAITAPPVAAAPPPAPTTPPVATAPSPAPTTPPVAAAPSPTPPVAEVAPPIPPVAAAPPPPERPAETPVTTKAPPRETASLTPASRLKHKPQPRPHATRSDDEAPAGNTASTDTSRAPPVDAADLPPLENTPTAAIIPPAPAPSAIGAPIPLVPRQPPERLSGSTTPTPRECRPYTGTTTLSGREAPVQGMACRDSDGQWHLVSETTPR